MAALKNARHERFVRNLVFEGLPQYKAYMKAGYSQVQNTARAKSSLLAAKVNIQDRRVELQERMAKASELTRSEILEMLAEDRKDARAAGQFSVGVKVSELLGKELHRMFTERRENINTQVENMTREQIIDSIRKTPELQGKDAEAMIQLLGLNEDIPAATNDAPKTIN